MGKAGKLKEQRKIEKVRNQIKKERKRRFLGFSVVALVSGIMIFMGAYQGVRYIKTKYFPDNEKSQINSYKTGDRTYSKEPNMQIDINKTYVARFETTNGNFEVTLNAKDAPKTTNNFVVLARDNFYDGLTFHRIVRDFMIQGGDPEGTGSGGPGYQFDDEPVIGDYTPGTIAMANSGKNTNGSQFFIMTGDYSQGKLPKDYVIFGAVVSGLDVVQDIGQTVTEDNGQGEQSKPVSPIVINKITIEEN